MGVRWIKLDRVDSTNRYLAGLLKREELRDEVVVIADYQESGRGQGNNRWHSNSGENLLMSVLLFPVFLSASSQFYLSRAVSLALCDLLHAFHIRSRIKWPNDIMTGRGKIAGILIEHGVAGQSLTHSIAGIGLNLNQTLFPPFEVPATSLRLETGLVEDPGRMAEMLHGYLQQRLKQLIDGSFEKMDREYLDLLYRVGETSLFISGNRSFQGIITGVNEYGELLVNEGDITQAYGFHAIKFSGY